LTKETDDHPAYSLNKYKNNFSFVKSQKPSLNKLNKSIENKNEDFNDFLLTSSRKCETPSKKKGGKVYSFG